MTLRLRVCVGVWWPCLCCRLNTSRRPSGTYTMPCQATWTTVSIVLSHTSTRCGWVAGCGQPAVGRHSSRPSGPITMSRAGTTGSINRRAGASLICISLQPCYSARRTSFLSSVSWYLNAVSVGTTIQQGSGPSGQILDGIQRRWTDNVSATKEVLVCLWTHPLTLNSENAWLLGFCVLWFWLWHSPSIYI